MRWLAILMLLAALLPAQDPIAAQEKTARVEGQVLSTSGKPLNKAAVRIEAASVMNQSNFSNYAVSTDSEGKFVFEEIAPGTYVFSAERGGYLRQWYGTKSTSFGAAQIKLDAGAEMKDVVIKLTAQGIIAGRIVDEDGEPLPNFSVRALHWVFANGKRRLQAKADQDSQADGTFVIGGLSPGRYLVSAADSKSDFGSTTIERSGNKKPAESNLITYFPNAIDVGSASLLEVAPGAEVRGIDIHVRRGRVFEIQGKIVPARGGGLILTPKDAGGNPAWETRLATTNDRTGAFQFKNVTPGVYVIRAEAETVAKDPTGEFSKFGSLAGRLEVTVSDSNLENVVVSLAAGPEIRGVFRAEGADRLIQTALARTPLGIELQDSRDERVGSSEADADGAFVIEHLPLDVMNLAVGGLTDNNYVKSIKFGDQDIAGKNLDLTSGGAGELTILISPNGAEVTGTVRDADGKPVAGAVVQLCRDGASEKTVTADHTGAFDVKGLAPGDYKAFAWDGDGDGVITDSDFRKSFESQATAVRLSEKSREHLDPVIITKDAMDVEAAKIK